MPSARKVMLKILEKAPKNAVELFQLSEELRKQRVLGFGVVTKDVVYALVESGRVRYDRKKDMVYLLPERPKVYYHTDAEDGVQKYETEMLRISGTIDAVINGLLATKEKTKKGLHISIQLENRGRSLRLDECYSYTNSQDIADLLESFNVQQPEKLLGKRILAYFFTGINMGVVGITPYKEELVKDI